VFYIKLSSQTQGKVFLYRLKHRRPIRTQSLKEYVEKTIGRSTNEDDVICSKCRSAYKRSVRDSYDTEGSVDAFVVDSAACKNDMISPKIICNTGVRFEWTVY
jgi:hypothetical protein